MWKGRKGIMIFSDLNVIDLQNQKVRLRALFYLNENTPLKDDDGKYDDGNSHNVVSGWEFFPRFKYSQSKRFRLFIPYDELEISSYNRPIQLQFYLSLQKVNADGSSIQLTSTSWKYFTMQ